MCSFTACSLDRNKVSDYFLDCTFHAVTHTESSASEFCIVISLNCMQHVSLMGSLHVTLQVFTAWNSDSKTRTTRDQDCFTIGVVFSSFKQVSRTATQAI